MPVACPHAARWKAGSEGLPMGLIRQRRTAVISHQWSVMTFHERFEQVVALILSAVITVIIVIIVVSLLKLIQIVFTLLIIDAFNPL